MSVTDSDTESTVSSQSRPTTATTTKSQPQQVFPFAHPPPKSTSCFRFTSRLLLQIQQLLSASRALPILEIYRPSSLGKSIPGCPSKVHSQDLYVVQSDAYQNLPSSCSQDTSTDSPVVGVIYTNYCSGNKTTSAATSSSSNSSSSSTDHKSPSSPSSSSSTSPTTKSPPTNNKNAIYLPQLQITLLASRTSRGGYTFQLLPTSSSSSSSTQKLTLELAKKKPKHKSPPRSSATTTTRRSSASTTPDDDEIHENHENNEPASFLLGIRSTSTSPGDPNSGDSARRSSPRPWLAGLSPKGIKVLRGEPQDQLRRRVLAAVGVTADRMDVLYTVTLMVGIYAARMEGWV
ncbi:hypothetical protein BO82DRAFT_393870 [Aspergillus uvarum CBS 121591]|uniref:Uncharacterized protein n=1 Tax=Aspergillus uvarum CBS 121591 TaxID=1448315 RepID=A0A319DJ35_9EURO|nr:hypothetical protein BO82DRAFT_393870 [Aspergillus uvarum CBS 121591]PYH79442.1 hypothetical protein BO82DRAFT_393870 [Aspergillus uvarum CBS 121591]